MMRDELYAEGSERAIREVALREPTMTRKEPEFGFWRTVGSVGKASIAGISETAATGSEIIKGFGQVSAATMPATMLGNVTQDQDKEQKDEMDRIRREGVDMDSEVGRALRSSAKDYMPDPETSHQAEVIIADFSRIMTKAVGSTLLTGTPIPAALEEGVTTTDKLQEKGIDKETAVKVGLVTAAANTVAFGLPIAGQTLKSTIGLAAASGPATYIAQESATRKILGDANYDNEAALHDPFNPLGLGLATVGSLIPGALVLGLRSRAARTTPAPSRAQVDAARVQVARDALDSNIIAPIDDIPARTAQRKAIEATHEQLSRGEPVSLTKAVPEEAYAKVGESKPFIDFVAKVDDAILEDLSPPPPEIAQFMTKEALSVMSASELEDTPVQAVAHNRAASIEGIRKFFGDAQASAAEGWTTRKIDKWLTDNATDRQDEWIQARYVHEDRVKEYKGAAGNFDSSSPEALGRSIGVMAKGLDRPNFMTSPEGVSVRNGLNFAKEQGWNMDDVLAGMRSRAFEWAGNDATELFKRIFRAKEGNERAATGAKNAPGITYAEARGNVDAPAVLPAEARPIEPQVGGESGPKATTDVARLADEMETNYPDMLVEMDGMPAMTVKDFMEAIRAQVADELAEVPLIQAATTCFLTFGSNA